MSDVLTSVERQPFEWIEIDQPQCSLAYGIGSCSAVLGTTGENKCFNTRATCQDPTNYTQTATVTLRFCRNQSKIPDNNYYFPYLMSASISPTVINPGGGNGSVQALGKRGVLSCTLSDHPHTDRIVDPYLSDRSYDPYTKGTFWTKWKARNPYYLHRVIRHKSGFLLSDGSIDPDTLITRTFFITKISGPTNSGQVQIEAQDILTLSSDTKAKAPAASTGSLASALTTVATSATLSPTGIGNLEYPASGKVRINKEIMSFTRSGDTLTLTRAQNNTEAAAHDSGDLVQLCLVYTSQAPKDILEDLLTTYAGVASGYLDTTQWATESTDFLPRLYSTVISEPTGVNSLINEMCEQMYFTTFWDDRNAKLKMRAIRPVQGESITELTDELNLLADSIQWADLPNELITQVWVYYAQKDPTEPLTEARNYGALEVITDTDAESSDRNGISRIKVIYARWLTGADGAAATELGEKILGRYNKIPRQCSFDLDAKDSALWLADFARITNRNQVDFIGDAQPVTMQIISAQEKTQGSTFSYRAVEYTGQGVDGGVIINDPDEYIVYISTDYVNVNLKTLFDSVYGVSLGSGDKVRFIVRRGVTIGSSILGGVNDNAFESIPKSYAGKVRYIFHNNLFDVTDASEFALDVTLPYISRQNIVASTNYTYTAGSGSTYVNPDTGVSTGLEVGATVIEHPVQTALTTGTWPAGVTLYLDIEPGAQIIGEAGVGGYAPLIDPSVGSGNWYPDGGAAHTPDFVRAGDGGHALEITTAININNQGIIAGGGGGGEALYFDGYVLAYLLGAVPQGFLNTVFLPGGGGAGYLNTYQNEIFVSTRRFGGGVDEQTIETMPLAPILHTEASIGVKQNPGLGAYIKTVYERVFQSGAGGALGSNGGTSSGTDWFYDDGGVDLFDLTFTRGKQGLAGNAIIDGKELITWVQKGDVRGSEA